MNRPGQLDITHEAMRPPHRTRVRWLAAIVLALVPASVMGAQATARPVLMVVVHAASPVENLSAEELHQIFLGEQQYWKNHRRITLLIPAAGSPERQLALRLVYRMDEAEFRRYWVRKLLRAEVPSGPTVVRSNALALELVATVPGAIALVSEGDVPAGVRIVPIDGMTPHDPGYRLR